MTDKKELNKEDIKDVNGGNKMDFNTNPDKQPIKGGAIYNNKMKGLRINSVVNPDNTSFGEDTSDK